MPCLFAASAFHNSWSRVFHPRMIDGPAFSSPAFSTPAFLMVPRFQSPRKTGRCIFWSFSAHWISYPAQKNTRWAADALFLKVLIVVSTMLQERKIKFPWGGCDCKSVADVVLRVACFNCLLAPCTARASRHKTCQTSYLRSRSTGWWSDMNGITVA